MTVNKASCVTMCVQVLIDWINSELEEERIIVKDLEEDCYDGQVLQKLFGEKIAASRSHSRLSVGRLQSE